MYWFNLLTTIVLFIYTIFILVQIFILLIDKKQNNDLTSFIPSEKISIIIPARNEQHYILQCLQSIFIQQYPKELLEIIFVDDNSEDNTLQIAEDFLKENFIRYKVIRLADYNLSGKKQAILKALEQATSTIIVTRDADTHTNNTLWLKTIAFNFKTTNCDLLISPVILQGNLFTQAFQRFENLAISALGHSMTNIKMPFVCSGANLSYKKDKFIQTNPYKDNIHIPSGDDMFLLESFYRNNFTIKSTKSYNSIIYTDAEKTIPSFIKQRVRWAAKASKLHVNPALGVGALLFLSNFLVMLTFCFALFCGLNLKFCLFTLISKCVIDFLLVFLSAIMFKQKANWVFFLPAFMLNLFYVPCVAAVSTVLKPTWKGR